MKGIPFFYKQFSAIPEPDGGDPYLQAAHYPYGAGLDARSEPLIINIAMSYVLWKNRIIWRVRPESAAILNRANISFIPETPPPVWGCNAFVVESADSNTPLLHDIFSIFAYRLKTRHGEERYFFSFFNTSGGGFSFSISADTGKLNRSLAESGEYFDQRCLNSNMLTEEYPAYIKDRAFDVIRFVFCASYYFGAHDKIEIKETGGPPKRNAKGKAVKAQGKILSLWSYSDVSMKREYPGPVHSGQLDRGGLSLEPVIVSPHIRRQGERVIIIDQYDSHRWKAERIGTKKTI